MANLLCSDKCGEISKPPTSFEKLCPTKKLRKKFGSRYMAFVSKNLVIDNPLDLALWCAAAVAGDIAISPCGKVDQGTPSQTISEDTNNCGEKEVLCTTYQPTFSTYNTDPLLTHCQYYENLVNNKCLDVIWFDCDGNPILNKEYRDFISGKTTTPPKGSPGFEFSMIQNPYPSAGEKNFEVWSFQLEIELDGDDIICPVLFPGIDECLIDTLPIEGAEAKAA